MIVVRLARLTATFLDRIRDMHYEPSPAAIGPWTVNVCREVRDDEANRVFVGRRHGDAAALPGFANSQKQTVVDPSWYMREPEPVSEVESPKNMSRSNRIQKDPDPPDMRFVPPKLDPPPPLPPPDPGQGPKFEEKPVPAKPTSLPKDLPPFELPPPLNPPPGQTVPTEPPPEPFVLALKCMLENRHSEALEHLKKYDDPATQELFIRILPLIAESCKRGLSKASPGEVAALYEQLESVKSMLRTRTELAIDKMCFCKSIKAYGVYEALPENHAFNAGAPGRPGDLVQLYVEVRNFASELAMAGLRPDWPARSKSSTSRGSKSGSRTSRTTRSPTSAKPSSTTITTTTASMSPTCRPATTPSSCKLWTNRAPEPRRLATRHSTSA